MSTTAALGIMVTVFIAAFGYLAVEMRGLRTELRAEIGGLRAALTADLNDLRTELRAEIGESRAVLTADLNGLRTELRREIGESRAEVGAKIDLLTERYIDHLRDHAS